jgi:hypothetical protein
MSKMVVTPIGRASFPQLFEAAQVNGEGPEKYNLTLIIEPDAPGLKELEDQVADYIKVKFPKLPKDLKTPILIGDDLDRPEYAGKIVLRLSCRADKHKPKVIDAMKNPITDPALFYSGCNCRATFTLYSWTYMGKSGVSIGLVDVQKVSENERLDGRPTTDSFGDLAPEDIASDVPY